MYSMNQDIFSVFPRNIQKYLSEVESNLNLNKEFMIGSILYTISVAIGNSYHIKLKNGWNYSSNIFMAIIGETGISKTPAISQAIAPLIKRNNELFKEWKANNQMYKDHQSNTKKDKIEKGVKASPPILNKIIAEDATIEAIFRSLSNNPKGFGIYYDEIIGFFNNMGKYNNGSDQELWLKIWSGKPITVDRATSDPILIPLPHISIIGGIQTALVKELFKGNRDKNGFVERLLFIMPKGLKKNNFPKGQMPLMTLDNYDEIIYKLLNLPLVINESNELSPNLLMLSDKALEKYEEYFNFLAEQVNQKRVPQSVKGFYPKMDAYCAKFALILQLVYWACDEGGKEEISERAVDGAIVLSNYFLNNALEVVTFNQKLELSIEHRKLFAIELDAKKIYSLREIASYIGVSHETVRKWINEQLTVDSC